METPHNKQPSQEHLSNKPHKSTMKLYSGKIMTCERMAFHGTSSVVFTEDVIDYRGSKTTFLYFKSLLR